MSRKSIQEDVEKAIRPRPVSDPHTHRSPPRFGASPTPGGLAPGGSTDWCRGLGVFYFRATAPIALRNVAMAMRGQLSESGLGKHSTDTYPR